MLIRTPGVRWDSGSPAQPPQGQNKRVDLAEKQLKIGTNAS